MGLHGVCCCCLCASYLLRFWLAVPQLPSLGGARIWHGVNPNFLCHKVLHCIYNVKHIFMYILYDEVVFKEYPAYTLLTGGSTRNNLSTLLYRVRSLYIPLSPNNPTYGITLVMLLLLYVYCMMRIWNELIWKKWRFI